MAEDLADQIAEIEERMREAIMAQMHEELSKCIAFMEGQLRQDEMQAAEMDERGDINQMDIYDKAVAVRREDLSLLKTLFP